VHHRTPIEMHGFNGPHLVEPGTAGWLDAYDELVGGCPSFLMLTSRTIHLAMSFLYPLTPKKGTLLMLCQFI